MSISISIVIFKCGFHHVANYAWVTYSCEKTFSLVSNSLPLRVKTMGARFVAMAPAEMMSFVAAAYRSYREVATKLGEMETGRKGFIVMLTNSVTWHALGHSGNQHDKSLVTGLDVASMHLHDLNPVTNAANNEVTEIAVRINEPNIPKNAPARDNGSTYH